MFKKDCFAFKKEGNCFALSEMHCEGCKFYKHSDDPKAEQLRLMKETNGYYQTSIYSGYINVV